MANNDKCYQCGAQADETCSVCGKPSCINCIRVPDPDLHDDQNDYCIPHYVEAGYADLWEMHWTNPQYGDGNVSVFDTPPDVHPFKIPALYGIPARWANTWKKLNTPHP